MSACVLGVAACIRDSLNTVLTLTAHTRWVDQPFLQTSMLESHSLPAALVTDICVSAGWRKLPFSRILQLCIPSSLLFAVSSSLWPCWDTVARCAATCCCCPGCVCLRLWTNSFLMVSFLKLETFYMSFTRRSVFPVLGLSDVARSYKQDVCPTKRCLLSLSVLWQSVRHLLCGARQCCLDIRWGEKTKIYLKSILLYKANKLSNSFSFDFY